MRISRRQMVKALAALPLVGTAVAAASVEKPHNDLEAFRREFAAAYGDKIKNSFGLIIYGSGQEFASIFRGLAEKGFGVEVCPLVPGYYAREDAYMVTVRNFRFSEWVDGDWMFGEIEIFAECGAVGMKTRMFQLMGYGATEIVFCTESSLERIRMDDWESRVMAHNERYHGDTAFRAFMDRIKAKAHASVISKHNAKTLADLRGA